MNIPEGVNFDEVFHVDAELSTVGLLTDAEIAADLREAAINLPDSDEDDDSAFPDPPCAKDVLSQLSDIRQFLQCQAK
jgi:hypothetical protein